MMLKEESVEDLERRIARQEGRLEDLAKQRLEHFSIQSALVRALLDDAVAGEQKGGVWLAAGAEQIREAMKLVLGGLPVQLDYEHLAGVGRDAALVMEDAYKESRKARDGDDHQVRKAQARRTDARRAVDWLAKGWQEMEGEMEAMGVLGEERIEAWKQGGFKSDDLGVLLESDPLLATERMQLVRLQSQMEEKAQEEAAPSV
jgi:hypothetical protein